MRIYGVDFTSAPRRGKPITCAACSMHGTVLRVDAFAEFDSLEMFENFLGCAGPWVAGLDFPFGQPRVLLERLGWPARWEQYVEHLESMHMGEFEHTLAAYRETRPQGDEHHFREVDRLANACSPMMMHRAPVGQMFFRGAPRLLRAGVNVLPCRPGDESRTVLEAYPALVARALIGPTSYKSDDLAGQTLERESARRVLCEALSGQAVRSIYGLRVALEPCLADLLIDEESADHLDALLCAVQAAWGWQHRRRRFGIPCGADAAEGWIVDPQTRPRETGVNRPSVMSSVAVQ